MLHLNDSKTPLGSNRDRHENIGEGDLGMDGFRTIVNEPAFAGLPGILEVPGFDGQGPDKENLARLRALVAAERRARRRRASESPRPPVGILGLRRAQGAGPGRTAVGRAR